MVFQMTWCLLVFPQSLKDLAESLGPGVGPVPACGLRGPHVLT